MREFSVYERDLDVKRPRFICRAFEISPRHVGGSEGILEKSSPVSLLQHFIQVRTLRGDKSH